MKINKGKIFLLLFALFAAWYVISGVVAFVSPAHSTEAKSALEASPDAKVLAAQRAIASQVGLRAKSWNDGLVHVWTNIDEANATHIDVAESASCIRMDDHTYKMGSGSTTLFYYKLSCNGIVGYVERDQVH